MKKNYRPRVVEATIRRKLRSAGAILLEGAKWCGKTTTADQFARSRIFLASPSKGKEYLRLAEVSPYQILEGETPRLIDEWQLAPQLWDAVRGEVDERGEKGQFILTGSATPPDTENIHHTGTGRFSWITMRPMSLFESGDSTGEVSLGELFESDTRIAGHRETTIDDVCFWICRGGWPSTIGLDREDALDQAYDYFDATVKTDMAESGSTTRAIDRMRLFMKAYARHQGSQMSINKLRADMIPNDSERINEETVAAFHRRLKDIFAVEDMPAWNPNIRSKSSIRTTETRYFVDPSIATSSLGVGPEDLKKDLVSLGLFFETMAVRDLRVYAQVLNGDIRHYRDSTGLECDAVVHLRDGRYGLIEIKLGGDRLIEEGVVTLKKVADRIDTDKMSTPAFLMVLTGVGEYAYRREDGVLVVPLSTLRN